MKKIIFPLLIVFAVFMGLAADRAVALANKAAPTEKELAKIAKNYSLKEWHKDFACVDCHGDASLDEYYLINSETCLSCHGTREEVAELTKELDANNVNPHRNFHAGTATECYECHREHKPSRNYCANCHDTDIWMAPVP